MDPATSTADSFNTPSSLPAPNQLRARMLIAAALALVVCRLVSLRHSVAGMAAGGIVMIALVIAIIFSMPRLRRWMFRLTLPVAAAVNAAALAVGSCVALMGSQGLLPGGRLGMKVAWQPLFWCVPVVAAITLWALARAGGPGLGTRRAAAVAANLLTALLGLWYWAIHEAQSNPFSAPPLGAVLLWTVAGVSLAALVWDAPASGAPPGRRRAWWRAGFVALTALPTVAAIVVAFLPIYQHRRDVAELESLEFSVLPGRLPRRLRRFDELLPVYDYLADVHVLWTQQRDTFSAADAARVEQLLQRLPALASLTINGLRPGAGRLLRPLAGRPFLSQLTLTGPGVTDETLTDIAALPGLTYLNVSHSSITDNGLALLANLPAMEAINLSGTKISGKGLCQLASLPRLWALELADTPLDDHDLSALETFPALTALNLGGTRVTDQGVARLRQALPRLSGVNVTLGAIIPGSFAVPAIPASAPTASAPAPAPPPIGESSE